MSDKLMDTEAGGEQTQYESVNTSVQPPDKQEGTLSGTAPDMPKVKGGIAKFGGKFDDNGKFKGFREGHTASSDQSAQPESSEADKDRTAQGYGSGTNSGA